MPNRGTQRTSLEQHCVWAGSCASAAVLLPLPKQIWLFMCNVLHVGSEADHTIGCCQRQAGTTPCTSESSVRPPTLRWWWWWAQKPWALVWAHTARLFLLPALWNVKLNWFGLCRQNFPKWTQRRSSDTDLSKKLSGNMDHFSFPQIQNTHTVYSCSHSPQHHLMSPCSCAAPGICPAPVSEWYWNGIFAKGRMWRMEPQETRGRGEHIGLSSLFLSAPLLGKPPLSLSLLLTPS